MLSGIHNHKQQQQLQAREEKRRRKEKNGLIKPDASKGRIISCQEARNYELAKATEKAEKLAAQEAKKREREAKRDARDAASAAQETERAAQQASRNAAKTQKEAEKLVRKWRREEDAKVFEAQKGEYAAILAEWEEAKADGVQGIGRKPKKPTMPKVRKEPPTADELDAATAHVMLTADEGGSLRGKNGAAGAGRPVGDPDDGDDDDTTSANGDPAGDGSSSGELIDLLDSDSDDSEYNGDE